MSSVSRRWVVTAGFGALLVFNLVLIALLAFRPSTPRVEGREASYVLPSADGEAAVTKREPAALSTADEDEERAQAQRLLAAADGTTAWRATAGSCGDPGTLERTVDSGETWEAVPLDVAPVSRIRVLNADSLFIIGGGEGCELTYVSSSTAGETWTTNDQYLVGSWFVIPEERAVIATPAGNMSAPCVVTELAGLDASHAAALCEDGSLALTADGGVTWAETTPDLRALALGVADNGYALAGVLQECGDDIAVMVTDTSANGAAAPSCTAISVNESRLAVSASGGVVWLWAGDEVLVSSLGTN